VAAFTTYKNDVDVAIFGVPDRSLYKNLTKGISGKYQYYVAQEFTMGRKQGRTDGQAGLLAEPARNA
jgi:hypothetical protein